MKRSTQRFAKAIAQRCSTYLVEWSDTLGNDWSTVGVSAPTILSDNGTTQQIKLTVPAGGGSDEGLRASEGDVTLSEGTAAVLAKLTLLFTSTRSLPSHHLMKRFFLAIFFALISLHSLSAAEYFISPSGDDQAAGTKEAPLASVVRGLEKLRDEQGRAGTRIFPDSGCCQRTKTPD